jgi:hypothetical protein
MGEGSEPGYEAVEYQYSESSSSAGSLLLLPPLSPSLSKGLVIELEQAEPLSINSITSIIRQQYHHHSSDGFEGRSDGEEKRLDMVHEVDNIMSISMLSMSNTSPVISSRSRLVDNTSSNNNNISMEDDNNSSSINQTRPRSSSNSSDRTERTLRRKGSHRIASTSTSLFPSTSSSSSSINSGNLTPLASPSCSNIQSHNSLDSTSTLTNSQTTRTPSLPFPANSAAPLSDHTAITTIARRHYRQQNYQEGEIDTDTDHQTALGGTSTEYSCSK